MFVEARADRSRTESARGVGELTGSKAKSASDGPALSSASGRFADRAVALERDVLIARGIERAMDKTAAILGLGAVAASALPGGKGLGIALGMGAGAAALAAQEAGQKAEESAKQAEAARKAEAEAKAKAEQAKRDAAKRASRSRGGDAFGGLRGDTYGGRASAHDPARADRISRTC